MHPFIRLARGYDAGQVTRTEYRSRSATLKATDPIKTQSVFGALKDETGCPSAFLAPIVNARIAKINKTNGSDLGVKEEQGARDVTAARLARILQLEESAAVKMIWRIQTEDAELFHIRNVDALVMALDIDLHNLPLPFLPTTLDGARNQIEGYFDSDLIPDEEKPNELETQRLIHYLHRFVTGFVNGGILTGDEITYNRQIRLDKLAARKLERRQERDLAS